MGKLRGLAHLPHHILQYCSFDSFSPEQTSNTFSYDGTMIIYAIYRRVHRSKFSRIVQPHQQSLVLFTNYMSHALVLQLLADTFNPLKIKVIGIFSRALTVCLSRIACFRTSYHGLPTVKCRQQLDCSSVRGSNKYRAYQNTSLLFQMATAIKGNPTMIRVVSIQHGKLCRFASLLLPHT